MMFPFPVPTVTGKTPLSASLPTLLIDGTFRILQINEAAALCGVQIGEYLLSPDADAKSLRLWHEACLGGAADTPLDPLSEEPLHIRIRIDAFHGFRLADIVYTYSLSKPRAAVVLYRSSRQFFRITEALSDDANSLVRRTQHRLDCLSERCVALLMHGISDSGTQDALLEYAAANALLTRIHLSAADCKRRFHISFLLNAYLSDVLPQMRGIDCRILRTPDAACDLSLPTDASAMFLLWTLIITVLNDLADDRCIRIGWNRYGEDGEIRFTAHTSRLTALPAHIPGVSVLAPYLPSLQIQLDAADYIAGCLDCYLDLYTDPAAGRITFSLYIPEEKHIPDFKSPAESGDLLGTAILCMRGMLRLQTDGTTAPSEAREE